MTFKQASKHICKVLRLDPMRQCQFENDMINLFCDSRPKDEEPKFNMRTRIRKGKKCRLYQLETATPETYKTGWHPLKIHCILEAATVYCHNNLKPFKELYDYPEEQAKEIIKNGFPEE